MIVLWLKRKDSCDCIMDEEEELGETLEQFLNNKYCMPCTEHIIQDTVDIRGQKMFFLSHILYFL